MLYHRDNHGPLSLLHFHKFFFSFLYLLQTITPKILTQEKNIFSIFNLLISHKPLIGATCSYCFTNQFLIRILQGCHPSSSSTIKDENVAVGDIITIKSHTRMYPYFAWNSKMPLPLVAAAARQRNIFLRSPILAFQTRELQMVRL